MEHKSYDTIIGQDHIKEHLRNAPVSHAYLICGEDGSGKRSIADVFVKTLVCENTVNGVPCHTCSACRRAAAGTHPDVTVVRPEKGSATLSVEQIRKGVVSDILNKPYEGGYKIYVVENAESMSIQAQNALLKTLEEPPGYGVIMLLANDASVILDTVKSRCITFNMQTLSEEQLEDVFSDRTVAVLAQGTIGRGRKYQEYAPEDLHQLLEAVKATGMIRNRKDAVMVSKLVPKETLRDYLEVLRVYFRDVLLVRCGVEPRLPELEPENWTGPVPDLMESEARLKNNLKEEIVLLELLLKMADSII